MIEMYVLIGHEAMPTSDRDKWMKSFGADRTVRRDEIDGVLVSTVFLGLDHSFGSGPPLLFETMIFHGPLDGDQWRYSTWDEAEAGHRLAVEKVVASVSRET